MATAGGDREAIDAVEIAAVPMPSEIEPVNPIGVKIGSPWLWAAADRRRPWMQATLWDRRLLMKASALVWVAP